MPPNWDMLFSTCVILGKGPVVNYRAYNQRVECLVGLFFTWSFPLTCCRAQAVQPWCRLDIVLLYDVAKSLEWIDYAVILF